MRPEVLAIAAAFCFSLGVIAVKFATEVGNVLVGFVVSLAVGTFGVGVLALAVSSGRTVGLVPAMLFCVAGIAGPGAGRVLMMQGVKSSGASIAAPVEASSKPIVATIAGVIVFNEAIGPGRVLALVLIVVGIAVTSRRGSANRSIQAVGGPLQSNHSPLVIVWPLLAGLAYGGADTLRKLALSGGGDPVIGAFFGMLTALTLWVLVLVFMPRLRVGVRLERSYAFFALNGLLAGIAQVFLFFALRSGDLSVVVPTMSVQPILVIALASVLLHRLEVIRKETVVGGVLVVVGILLNSVW